MIDYTSFDLVSAKSRQCNFLRKNHFSHTFKHGVSFSVKFAQLCLQKPLETEKEIFSWELILNFFVAHSLNKRKEKWTFLEDEKKKAQSFCYVLSPPTSVGRVATKLRKKQSPKQLIFGMEVETKLF